MYEGTTSSFSLRLEYKAFRVPYCFLDNFITVLIFKAPQSRKTTSDFHNLLLVFKKPASSVTKRTY